MNDTRERIIQSAIDLFSEHGYTETNMRAIAKNAGIKASSIYNHITSKSMLLEIIVNIYKEYTNKNTISKSLLADMMENQPADEIIRQLFYSFPKSDADQYRKILKIILHEQYREPIASAYMKDHFFGDTFRYIKGVLDTLVEHGKIAPADTGYYTKLFLSLTLYSLVESMFYTLEDYQSMNRVRRSDVNEFLIAQLVDGSGA